MCGIAGFVARNSRAPAESVASMVHSLARRGPDGSGIECWPGAVLGHRRLAIFDLSDLGKQPMMTRDRSIATVFNGAIYNFHDLRAELRACGYQFASQTDTEVLLHGYKEWGIDRMVEKLRGMFAFVLWDDALARLFLVRDRLGVKPLCYAETPQGLAFASTPRALRDGEFAGEIDPLAVAEFLEFGYVTDARCIYSSVKKVPAATILEWSDGQVQTRQYWTLPEISARESPSFDEAVEETERRLLKAVEIRLNADVPVGALLSGGIDSSLVCWAVSKLGGDLTAFTVGTAGDDSDETADATETARILGIKHRVVQLRESEAPETEDLIRGYAEPFACASALGVLRVARAIKPFATVLLTGEGGDDVFLGYPEHRHLWAAQRFAAFLPAAAARFWTKARGGTPQWTPLRRAVHFLDYASGGVGAAACARPGLPSYGEMLGERMRSVSLEQRAIPWTPEAGRRVLRDFLHYDRAGRFTGEYMTKIDGGTMYHALEARAPFLDQQMWEFAARLPFGLRLKGGELKAVLREIARRHLGSRVADAPKRGFTIPVSRWLSGEWRETVNSAFEDSLLAREGWVQGSQLRTGWEKASGGSSASFHFWYLFVLESWLRQERTQAIRSFSR